MGQDAASISHHYRNTNVVHHAVGQVSPSQRGDNVNETNLFSIKVPVDSQSIKFRFHTANARLESFILRFAYRGTIYASVDKD